MMGAAGNICCGLFEFKEMVLILHFLRPGETLVDVRANIGSFIISASGHVGAKSIAFVLIFLIFRRFWDNVPIN